MSFTSATGKVFPIVCARCGEPVPVGCSKVVRDHRQVREASS